MMESTTISENHKGNLLFKENQPLTVPDNHNTSLWITKLPQNIEYKGLLNSIRKTGNVKSLHINPPIRKPGTCAATLVYFEHAAAQKLYDVSEAGGFIIWGHHPVVRWNRIGTIDDPPDGRSRVLRIEGPRDMVARKRLEAIWSEFFQWDTDEVFEVGKLSAEKWITWYHFGSWHSQAASAMTALQKEHPGIYNVTYSRDPCS
ncbi:hypothetical protein F4779DRAFT_60827 [Xylariaceae sp. FL0662B]|nr:hypothetical protein F4779DRAFT_60827 [Xylariaceae sp. FL0662B]